MKKIFVALACTVLLSACDDISEQPTSADMIMDSEDCRAAASTEIAREHAAKAMESGAQLAAYDQVYRSCMSAKGYGLTTPAP